MTQGLSNKACYMQIGWRELVKSQFRKASKFHTVGIEWGVDDVHISTLQKLKGSFTWVKQHSMSANNWQENLKTYVEQNQLANTKCNVALSISKYQLLQVDRPAVEDDELLNALQWTVKEQLSSDDEVCIDYFDPPAVASSTKKLNVVAVAVADVIAIRDGVLSSGLVLNSISVEELATCNIVPPSDEASITLKHEAGGQLSLSIVKGNRLFFARRLRGYENLANFSPEEMQMGIADNLSLEIQRSMDYFESQLRQAPIKKVYISLDTLHHEALADLIQTNILIPVEKLVPTIEQKGNMPLAPASYTSLGAAMENTSLVA